MSFSFKSIRFKPTLVPTLAALAAVLLTGYLGQWQQERAAEKRALQLEFEARSGQPPVMLDALSRDPALRYRQASADGEWHAAGQIFVDNQVRNEVAGFHVITPLKLHGTDSYVLVNRGWIARGPSYPTPPATTVPVGRVSVTGLLTLPSTRFLELSDQSVLGAVWQNLTIDRYRVATKLDVLPFVLLAADTQPPMEKVTEHPNARASKHLEYMLTWYSLAATVIVLWVVLNARIVQPELVPQRLKAGSRHLSKNKGSDS